MMIIPLSFLYWFDSNRRGCAPVAQMFIHNRRLLEEADGGTVRRRLRRLLTQLRRVYVRTYIHAHMRTCAHARYMSGSSRRFRPADAHNGKKGKRVVDCIKGIKGRQASMICDG
eukprot:GHVU01066527.1.p1 GENE.GHVU01066527.1~~GHVU01066527.1.p1  ORF type:complete len:114 (+),score=2.88 GHVU01066527.1:503-844(+)